MRASPAGGDVLRYSNAMPGKPSVLLRVTWALVWLCVRMLLMVAMPILRLSPRLRWLQVLLLLSFVVLFFYHPVIAYYWFWSAALFELAAWLAPAVLGQRSRIAAWLRRGR